MDQDELSAALRNQGLIRQARYADRDGTTAKATIKRMRKAGSSGTTQFTCHCKTLQFAHCYVCNDGQTHLACAVLAICHKQNTTGTATAHAPK